MEGQDKRRGFLNGRTILSMPGVGIDRTKKTEIGKRTPRAKHRVWNTAMAEYELTTNTPVIQKDTRDGCSGGRDGWSRNRRRGSLDRQSPKGERRTSYLSLRENYFERVKGNRPPKESVYKERSGNVRNFRKGYFTDLFLRI